jgi:hypothetical protein
MVPFTSNICCGFGVPIPTFPNEATAGPFTWFSTHRIENASGSLEPATGFPTPMSQDLNAEPALLV